MDLPDLDIPPEIPEFAVCANHSHVGDGRGFIRIGIPMEIIRSDRQARHFDESLSPRCRILAKYINREAGRVNEVRRWVIQDMSELRLSLGNHKLEDNPKKEGKRRRRKCWWVFKWIG